MGTAGRVLCSQACRLRGEQNIPAANRALVHVPPRGLMTSRGGKGTAGGGGEASQEEGAIMTLGSQERKRFQEDRLNGQGQCLREFKYEED